MIPSRGREVQTDWTVEGVEREFEGTVLEVDIASATDAVCPYLTLDCVWIAAYHR